MAKIETASIETDLHFTIMAHSIADEDTRRGVKRVRCREYEAALKRVASRLGMSVYEMYIYLGMKDLILSLCSPDGW